MGLMRAGGTSTKLGRLAEQAAEAGSAALRWVTGAAVPTADGGLTWPLTRAPGAPLADDLYDGTAGILLALAEARLSGITEFDIEAAAAARRLRSQLRINLDNYQQFAARDRSSPHAQATDLSLYTGLGGMLAALYGWALTSTDTETLAYSAVAAGRIASCATGHDQASRWLDLLQGEAGVLLVTAQIGGAQARAATGQLAARLAGQAHWIEGLPDWQPHTDASFLMPNFSHGLAGIGYALAAAAGPLSRPDLLELASLCGRRLVMLGLRPDGSLAVPHSIPPAAPQEPVSFGWCHGPTGTLQFFRLLDRLQPEHGWDRCVLAGGTAVRGSGLPDRKYPGFWDNLGQCCGTAGVGEMALDRYQESADPAWLEWAALLASDVLARQISDSGGARWSHTEHRASPPLTEPALGLMQGAAGIACFLLRLARVIRRGTPAAAVWRADRPAPAHSSTSQCN